MMPDIFGARRPGKGIITVNCKTGRATDQVRRITSKYRVDFSFIIWYIIDTKERRNKNESY